MGHFTAHQSKAELVRKRTAPWQTEEVRGTTLAHCVRGPYLWKVVEIERKASGARERYIALDLLAYQGGSWGYKDLCEAEHPYYYSCPLGYLDRLPSVRPGVREYALTIAISRWASACVLSVAAFLGCGSRSSNRCAASTSGSCTACGAPIWASS